METLRVEKVVQNNGTVIIEDLPFDEGETVEIIIVKPNRKPADERYPLRGTEYQFDDPFEPVVLPEDWETLG
jgi:hypothetical protein